MTNLLVKIDYIPEGRFCKNGTSCRYLKYWDGCNPYCSLFDNKSLRENEACYPYRCRECKEAEDRYTLYEQKEGYRHPFYQVED